MIEKSNRRLETDVLVVGGGASGVCAAIQAARMGVQVVLVEETPWLGGMLTAAGVSATDGNHKLPSGLWGEFRRRLHDHYGGQEAVATGWVSNTQFEPHVGNRIFHQMVREAGDVTVIKGFWVEEALLNGHTLRGARFRDSRGSQLEVAATVSIDATEYGDLMALAGCDYRVGRESRVETGEPHASEQADDVIQDLTYVAILKDYGDVGSHLLPRPEGYNPEAFRCTCREVCDDPSRELPDRERMIQYGRLPNGKYMINWPFNGNDYYLNVVEASRQERLTAYRQAKLHTLRYVYFLQNRLGFKHLGLADDEFPTEDHLALIPYIRESRRLMGVVKLTTQDIVDPYRSPQGALYQTGIAVGDYPLDHHHWKAPRDLKETYPDIPAYNVPYGCLIPREVDGLLVGEKSISVSHLVNGTTRLQPVVMQIGQAAGASAALAVQNQRQPRQIAIRQLQQVLLDASCWLMPFSDVPVTSPDFQSIQRVALTGALKGQSVSQGWANELLFHPNDAVSMDVFRTALQVTADSAFSVEVLSGLNGMHPTRMEALEVIWRLMGQPTADQPDVPFMDTVSSETAQTALKVGWQKGWLQDGVKPPFFHPDRVLTRRELAVLLDRALGSFNRGVAMVPPGEMAGSLGV